MKRPRKFYRDKELRRRVLEANGFERYKYFYEQDSYKTVFILSSEARKHSLYKALVEVLPLVVCNVWHSHKPVDPITVPVDPLRKSIYVKLKPEHQACFERVDKHYDGYSHLLRRRHRAEKQEEPDYYLLEDLKKFIIPITHKCYTKSHTWMSNPFEPSLERNAIRLKARKIFDEMNDDDWFGSRCKRALKTIDIQKDVKKELVDLT